MPIGFPAADRPRLLDPKQANAEGIFVGFLTAEEIDTASGQRSGRW